MRTFVAALYVSCIAIFCSSPSALAQNAAINQLTVTKIGALLSLSGHLAPVGTSIRQGIELALEEQRDHDWMLIVEDDRSIDRVTSVTAANKLISVDKVDLLLVEAMSSVSAIVPIVDRNRVPTIVVWDSNKAISLSGKFLYGFGFSNELAGEQMADFALHTLEADRFAVIKAQNDWSELIAQAFTSQTKIGGGTLVMDELVNGDAVDFRTLIAKAKKQQADVIYAPLWGAGLHAIVRQAKELQFQGRLLTGDGLLDEDLSKLGASAEGIYATQAWFKSKEFRQRYEAKFVGDASHSKVNISGVNLSYAALGYDVIGMLAALRKEIEAQGLSMSRETVQRFLPQAHHTGVLGEVSFSGDHLSGRRESLLLVKNGNFELVQ